MTERDVSLSPAKWTVSIIVFVALTSIAILLDIPFLRQISGFIFLAFVPGFLVLSILKLNKLGLVEKIVLTVGLSISFVMIFGILLNSLLLALGYVKPLSTITLLASFGLASIILALVAYISNKGTTLSFLDLKLSTREKALLIVPAMFPLLSIVGLGLMNLTEDNALLFLLLSLIPAYIIFISFFNQKVPERVYPITIFLISISLVILYALRSNHLLGADIHQLYYFYRLTLDNLHWSLVGPELVEASLITSLFPAIYQNFLNMAPELLYKLLFSVLFSITPLVVYVISNKYIGNLYGFLASFFFMSQYYFPWTAGIANTAIAILFFALVMMVLFQDDIRGVSRQLLLIVFMASSIVSHYTASFIFLAVLLLASIGRLIISRFVYGKRVGSAPAGNPDIEITPPGAQTGNTPRSYDADASQSSTQSVLQLGIDSGVTITIAVLFSVMAFFWYSQITVAAFNIGVGVLHNTFTNFGHWFLLEARGPTVVAATGKGVDTAVQYLRLLVSWLTVAFIAIGVLTTLVKYKSMLAIPKSGNIKPNFLKAKLGMDIFVMMIVCSAILVISVILPYVLKIYSMERTYYQLIVILSPFFVLGGIFIARLLKVRPYLIILLVLIPFFLSTTGVLYEVMGQRVSVVLDPGHWHERLWVYDQESHAAKWIVRHGEEGVNRYASPAMGLRVFVSQSVTHPTSVRDFSDDIKAGRRINGYIFLRNIDIATLETLTEYPEIFDGKNKIYTSGISEVYR